MLKVGKLDKVIIADKEISDELVIADNEFLDEIIVANIEKARCSADLVIANKELAIQNKEKRKLEAELNRVTGILKKHNLYKP